MPDKQTDKKPVNMVILTTEANHDFLQKMFKELDNGFGYMGSGGYKISTNDVVKGAFIFTECDCAPAKSYLVGLKKRAIWTTADLAHYLAAVLISKKICFEVRYREFESKEAARKEFAS